MTIWTKLVWALQRRRKEAELREEIAFHIDAEAEEAKADGLSDEHARRAARRGLGNAALIEEDVRAVWGWRWVERLNQDLRYAFRIVRRRPGFTAAAIVSLMLGIGANTAVFSLLHALLLETLPVDRPRELVKLIETRRESATPYESFTYATFEAIRGGSRSLSGAAAASSPLGREIVERGEKVAAATQLVSDNYFALLGVSAVRGRTFSSTDGEPTAVISDAFWRRHYGADPGAIGSRFTAYKHEITVVGIAPPGFRGLELERAADVWIPFDQVIPAGSEDRQRGRWARVIGRLAPTASIAQAGAEGTALVGRAVMFRSGATGYSTLRTQLLRPLVLVELVVALVLLITCVNLANLTLSGNLARERELAVRRALGASRRRLVAQLLTESLLLAAVGGALALLVAYWISAALLSFLPPVYAPALAAIRFELDARTLGFAVLISCITCLSFGLLPALRSVRSSPSGSLGVKGSSGERARSWASRGLIVGEVVMCTVLLMLAGVFVRSVQNLRGQDGGYRETQLLVADVGFPFEYSEDRRDGLIEAMRARVADLPDVDAVAFSHIGQLSGGAFEYRIGMPGVPFRREDAPLAIEQRVSPGFFAAMGTRLIEGRDFSAADTASSKPVTIVNELFAARFFPGRSAIGQSFFQDGGSRSGEPMEIIGIVQNSKWVNLRLEADAMYYRPYGQQGGTPVVRFAVRGGSSPEALAASIASIAQDLDRKVSLSNVVPFREIVNRSLLVERLVANVSTAFGVLALLIAGVGLYGVLAYSVTRRRREIGVRMAVGASRGAVEWMFLRESCLLLAAGVALGVPPAILIIRAVSSMLYGLTPYDPGAIALVIVVLTAVTLAAAYPPARRAASIDPILALREE
jgi:predicted permease